MSIVQDAVAQLVSAVDYVLTRAQTDPDLGYLLGPATEAWERLVKAEAAAKGVPADILRNQRLEDLQPEHRYRRAGMAAARGLAERWRTQARTSPAPMGAAERELLNVCAAELEAALRGDSREDIAAAGEVERAS